jgi:hypothetical protein
MWIQTQFIWPFTRTLLISDRAWKKDAPEALLDGRVEFAALNFFEDIPVVGRMSTM